MLGGAFYNMIINLQTDFDDFSINENSTLVGEVCTSPAIQDMYSNT
jgi:hypothetical protein